MSNANGRIRTLGTAVILLVATSTTADAQHRGEMHGDTTAAAMRCPGNTGGMGMTGANPSMLLAQGDVLDLTDDQVARLEKLQEEQPIKKGMHEGMMAARSQMRDAMAADSVNLDAHRKAVRSMADQMVSHHMQMARFREQVLDVLTPEQRERLQTGMRMMRHRMGGHGGDR